MDITENGEDVGLKFIPRIDLNAKDDGSLDATKKRKKPTTNAGTMRRPQRLFNYEEIIKVWGRKYVSRRNPNPKAIMKDRWPSLFQTRIPKVLDYPIRSMSWSWCVFFIFSHMRCRNESFIQGISKEFGAVPLCGWLAH
jgi:hypothetical protein